MRALDEGRCSLEVGAWSWGALAASFCCFEVAMEVVGPPALTEAFAVLTARHATTARAGQDAGDRDRSPRG